MNDNNNTQFDNDVQQIDSKSDSLVHKTSNIPVVQQLLLLSVILLLIFGSAITPRVLALMGETKINTAAVQQQLQSDAIAEITPAEIAKVPFVDIKIAAKSAYVWDVKNQKVLFKKDETKQLPLASVTKLMTALIAQEVLDEKDAVTVEELSIKQDGDSGLVDGEIFDRLSLSDFVLMASSNDGAYALAAAVGSVLSPNGNAANAFVHAMNIRAKEIGLSETYFKNPTGLDISPQEGGAYGSARDMAFLMEYIIKNEPDILTFTKESEARVYSETGQYHDAENTNYYVEKIPGLIGSKTGYTDLAGGNLVIAFNVSLDRPIVAVVLGSTQQERFSDILKLVEDTQQYVLSSTQQ